LAFDQMTNDQNSDIAGDKSLIIKTMFFSTMSLYFTAVDY